ncbi:uncharacterized protein [Aegilops tauschii subsp. strangulata]|uniref:uncharacterized protein n=1 Tax=Aegilops tauschii subsp. strangulata TaxID=200361 RepID=UPI003CC8601D
MASLATSFYGNLYASENTAGIEEVLSHIPPRVDAAMNDMLNAQYTNSEVKAALFQMFPTKAPGPDGFPAHFFQRHWELCGDEVTDMVLRVLKGEDSPEEINKTFIVLIPKIASPKNLGQFRPISLCNVIFKIASKVLANRLKLILPDIISEEQSAFVPGRLIMDNFISAYECLHYMKARKLKSNSAKQEEFSPSRGLRQGDPISPYLFLLAAEGLSCLLKAADPNESVRGIKVAESAPEVNHLLFADDSLLFFDATPEMATKVDLLLQRYCGASGQRINKDRSSIYFSKADVGRAKEGSFKYLKDRIWKHVQAYKRIVEGVLVGIKEGGKEDCLGLLGGYVTAKMHGRNGFCDIELFNLALLARQAWRLLTQPDSLSARILRAVYYLSSSILEAEVGKNPSQVWRSIVEGRDALKLGLVKRIGSGEDTNIWHDNWIPRDYKLRPVCPKSSNPPQQVSELINSVTFTWDRALLQEHMYPMDMEAILNTPLSSRIQADFWSWHYERKGIFTVRSAYRLLASTKQQCTDWLEHNDGHSNVQADSRSWAKLWGAAVPSKVRVFAWRLAKTSIPTGAVRKHRSMADSAECSICHAAVDSWRHALFDCHMARCVWALADEDITETIISN